MFRKTEAIGTSSYHTGDLELITWEFKNEDGTILGWGGVELDEV